MPILILQELDVLLSEKVDMENLLSYHFFRDSTILSRERYVGIIHRSQSCIKWRIGAMIFLQVMLDGVDIRRLQMSWVRAITCIVSQDPVIWSATVRENIKFGKLDATDEEIVEAARKSNSIEFVMKLPNQFDTQVKRIHL